jgi:hypothetical protein
VVTFFVGHLWLDCRGPVEVIVGAGVVVGAEIGISTIVRASLPVTMIRPLRLCHLAGPTPLAVVGSVVVCLKPLRRRELPQSV